MCIKCSQTIQHIRLQLSSQCIYTCVYVQRGEQFHIIYMWQTRGIHAYICIILYDIRDIEAIPPHQVPLFIFILYHHKKKHIQESCRRRRTTTQCNNTYEYKAYYTKLYAIEIITHTFLLPVPYFRNNIIYFHFALKEKRNFYAYFPILNLCRKRMIKVSSQNQQKKLY